MPKEKRQLLKQDEKEVHKMRKNGTTVVDNSRKRLVHAFGRWVPKLYSEPQDREEPFLRAFEHLGGEELDVFDVLTVGIRAVLADIRENAEASLLLCRSCVDELCYPVTLIPITEHFSKFTTLLGIYSFPTPTRTEAINHTADKLWTANMTRMRDHYLKCIKPIADRVFMTPRRVNTADCVLSGLMSQGPSYVEDAVLMRGVGFENDCYGLDIFTFCDSAREVKGVTEQLHRLFNFNFNLRRKFSNVVTSLG